MRLISKIPLEILILIFFAVVYAALLLSFEGEFTCNKNGAIVPFGLMLILIGIASAVYLHRRRIARADCWWCALQSPLVIIKDWLPVPLLILIYELDAEDRQSIFY